MSVLFRTSELIDIFNDTLHLIESDPELKQATEKSCSETKCYKENFVSAAKREKAKDYNIIVKEGTSFQCAQFYLNRKDKIAVLNFANPYEPGGGVGRGSRAQEESLCRCSNLYNSISGPLMISEYYSYHNMNKENYLFSDQVIYSPDIKVLKDDKTYEMLAEPFSVDVITCAAPYNVYGNDISLLESVYEKRLTNIFEVAAENDVDILILGAFGCGVFRNPPQLMAETFKRLIITKYHVYFKNICFPLIKSVYNRNFEVFSDVLRG